MNETLKPHVPGDVCTDDNSTGSRLSSPADSHVVNIPYSILGELFRDAADLVASGQDTHSAPREGNEGKYNIANE